MNGPLSQPDTMGASFRLFTSRLYALNSCIVDTPDLVLVVDPGYLPDEIEGIRSYVDEMRQGRPLYLLLTHSDSDHIAGYGAFADATVIASQAFVEHPDREAAVEEVKAIDDDFYIDRPYPLIYPKVDHVIGNDGQQLTVGRTTLQFFQAVGHNRDGLAAWIEPGGLLMPGDYLSDLEFPFVTDSYEAYDETLAKLSAILQSNEGATLIPCHGSITADPAEIDRRIRLSETYLSLVADIASGAQDSAAYGQFVAAHGLRFPHFLRKQHEANLALYRTQK
ncbi:MBL fold metallo-hydrolase [Paenibacillus daejeonensis]|uniref:MBL fold metallo-hydrolase n=1 Tax=Paenibacillus daejeonensis TaxID=135193 RepID=UPI000372B02E|nr:MBL fold metallo-hydrolase [Paenibacillus daejeonensis]